MVELGLVVVLLIAAVAGVTGLAVGIIAGRRLDARLQRAEDDDGGDDGPG